MPANNSFLPSNNLLPCLVTIGVFLAIQFLPAFEISHPDGKRSVRVDSGDVYEGAWVKGRFEGRGSLTKANKEVVEGTWTVVKPTLGEGAGQFAKMNSTRPIISQRKEIEQYNGMLGSATRTVRAKDKATFQGVLVAKDTVRVTTYTRTGGCYFDSASYEEADLHIIDTVLINNEENYFQSHHYQVVAGK